jgi:hypothetical protein
LIFEKIKLLLERKKKEFCKNEREREREREREKMEKLVRHWRHWMC